MDGVSRIAKHENITRNKLALGIQMLACVEFSAGAKAGHL